MRRICCAVLLGLLSCEGLLAQEFTLDQIMAAWKARAAKTQTVSATWIVTKIPEFKDKSIPADPDPEPQTATLLLTRDGLRYDWNHRYYDIDGGRGGSMCWQTGRHQQSYSPSTGWKGIVSTSLPKSGASALIGRPPQLSRPGLSNYGLFTQWFRSLNPELTLCDPTAWQITTDPRFLDRSADYVTLIQGEPGEEAILLYLDPHREFIPVMSRVGRHPGETGPMMNYRQCRAEFRSPSSPDNMFGLSEWLDQQFENGRLRKEVTMASLVSLALNDLDPNLPIDIEFPENAVVSNEAKRRVGQPSDRFPRETTRTSRATHPWSSGYWIALISGGLLLFLLVRQARNS